MGLKRFFTVKEASEYLGIPEGTLYQWRSQGKIRYTKIYGCLRFDRLYLDEFVEECTVEARK